MNNADKTLQPRGEGSRATTTETVRANELWRLIWQLAGIVGVAPGPLTLRELIWMVESRRREAWQHTSAVLATLANIHRDPKKKPRPFTTQEFHPMAEGKSPAKPPKADIQLLKRVFVERK